MNKKSTTTPPAGVHEVANRKRDNIIRHVRPKKSKSGDNSLPSAYDEALKVFDEYLIKEKKKRTPERLFVLKKIYECQTPVDIQTLHQMVCEEEGLVSLTTIYNNLSLLIGARLVRRLDLVGKMSFFEKTLGQTPHGYIVCSECGSIKVLEDPVLFESLSKRTPRGFHTTDVTLLINGTCQKCEQARRRALGKTEKKTQKKNKQQ